MQAVKYYRILSQTFQCTLMLEQSKTSFDFSPSVSVFSSPTLALFLSTWSHSSWVSVKPLAMKFSFPAWPQLPSSSQLCTRYISGFHTNFVLTFFGLLFKTFLKWWFFFADLSFSAVESEGGCQEGHGHQLRIHFSFQKVFFSGTVFRL